MTPFYIIIRIINRVLPVSRKVESNKIGLKTCERISQDMGGNFIYRDEGQLFTVRINLPIVEQIKEESTNIDTVTKADAETDTAGK